MDKIQEQLKKVNGEREEDAVQIQEYNVSRGGSKNSTVYYIVCFPSVSDENTWYYKTLIF